MSASCQEEPIFLCFRSHPGSNAGTVEVVTDIGWAGYWPSGSTADTGEKAAAATKEDDTEVEAGTEDMDDTGAAEEVGTSAVHKS